MQVFERHRIDLRAHQHVARAELFAAPVGDPEEMESEVGFENRGKVADGRLERRRFEFGHELPPADVFVATAFVFRARIFRVARGRQCHAHLAEADLGPDRIERVANAGFLGFRDCGLQDELAVAHGFGNQRQAVGGCGRVEGLDLGGRRADLFIDRCLHPSSQQLLADGVGEFGFPLGDGLAIFRFKSFHCSEHANVIGQTPLDLLHHLILSHFQAVQLRLMDQQLGAQDVLEDHAAIVGIDLPALHSFVEHLRLDVAFEHDAIADDGHNRVEDVKLT